MSKKGKLSNSFWQFCPKYWSQSFKFTQFPFISISTTLVLSVWTKTNFLKKSKWWSQQQEKHQSVLWYDLCCMTKKTWNMSLHCMNFCVGSKIFSFVSASSTLPPPFLLYSYLSLSPLAKITAPFLRLGGSSMFVYYTIVFSEIESMLVIMMATVASVVSLPRASPGGTALL